ncbi:MULTISPECIES: ABC transporter permease [unclassified Dysgonomonas]|jgi:ABC-2 type transport system permease protein|uniref:ABC transporter permease n=1 Tax=unclassified Dysgonomonas TaxID=2630389 RepID=UPI0025B86D9A|nr:MULTISPECIES: ABC transporter permease [unclassified Dysgonomonas]MDR2002087.1 ABC transporter permease [Prevotella sp.]HMM02620.1 ABC transporter permease [Dysgonomonas sp.]
MKQFISFVKKEFFHIFRDRRTMLILLGMPIVQIILFGFAITTEVKNTQIAIFDLSKDISTQRITEQLQASEYFTVTEVLNSPDDIDRVFKEGKVNLVVVFGENFSDNLLHTGEASVQLITDATDPNQASMLSGYATSIVTSYQQELMQEYKVPFQIIPEIRMLYNPQLKSAYNFVPGVMGLILMLICAMMTSIAIVREKELGTMEVLLASPIKPIYIILAKMVPYFTLSFVNLSTILLLSVFVLQVPVAGSLFWLTIVSILFIMVALALGLLVSTIVDTQVAAMLVSGMGFMMPVMLLSGMIFPIESMPAVLQWFSDIIPAKWYVSSVRKLMIEGVDVVFVLKEMIILLVMAIFLIVISLKKFKTRLT